MLIIGLFDLLSTVKVSLQDPAWSGFGVEAYLFAALVYFAFCYAMSAYSRRLEVTPPRRRREAAAAAVVINFLLSD